MSEVTVRYETATCAALYDAIMRQTGFALTYAGETRPKRRVYYNGEAMGLLGGMTDADPDELEMLLDEVAFEFIDVATQGEEDDGQTFVLSDLLRAEQQTNGDWLVPFGEGVKVVLSFRRQG